FIYSTRLFASRVFLLCKNIKLIRDEVQDVVGLIHHLKRSVVVVVVLTHLQICLMAVVCNRTKLEVDSRHNILIIVILKLTPSWFNVNESSNKTRLCIRDFNRLVGTHK